MMWMHRGVEAFRSVSVQLLAVALAIVLFGIDAKGQDLCSVVEGATVVADDGTYLGKVTNHYDRESIFNEYGNFGGEYSRTSIWNQYGKYGGEYSRLSAFNQYTRTPPALVKRGEIIAYLTTNKSLRGAVSPWVLKSCEF